MNEKLMHWFAITMLLLAIVAVGGVFLFMYQHFPQLENDDDAQLISESLQADYAPSICLVTINQKQMLYTTQSDGVIWQRTSEQWAEGEKRILGNGGEAQYQRNIMLFVTLRSRMFFHHTRPYNVVYVNNQVIFQLSGELCHPLEHLWRDTQFGGSFFGD